MRAVLLRKWGVVSKYLLNFYKTLKPIYFRKKGYFVDLFVRKSNQIAINMYKNLGYIIYRTILEYYSGDKDEDAYGKSNCNAALQKQAINFLLINNYLIYRYAKGLIPRCGKEICHTVYSASTIR